MGPGSSITFHRGEKSGPVIATADCCQEKQGSSKIEMIETSTNVVLEHLPRRMIVLPPKTSFTISGKKYYWKGYTDLFEEKTDKLLAQYQPTLTEGSEPCTGQLIIAEGANFQLNDLIVISSIVMQQRSEARKRAVSHLQSVLIYFRDLLSTRGAGEHGKTANIASMGPRGRSIHYSF